MAVWSTMSSSNLEYSRIDADFYHPRYLSELDSWKLLQERLGTSKLRELISTRVRTGHTPRSREIKPDDELVPFIKTDTLREGSIDFGKCDALPTRVLAHKDYIQKNAVVVTIIGATPDIVGRAAIVRSSDPECVTNQNIAIICANDKCDPYYLTAYFQTSLGRDQLWRHSRRTEQVNLNCREVERVLVPTPPDKQQKQIGDLIRQSFKASDRSSGLYQEAKYILELELGLDKLNFKKPVGYTARFSELEELRRTDAEYFHTKYEPFLDAVRNYITGWLPLKQLTNRTVVSFDSRKQKGDFDYIEIGDISVGDGSYTKSRVKVAQLPANAKIALSGGEIIISQVRPTRGAIAIVEDVLTHPTICSGAFYVCNVKNTIYREIIWLYLRIMKSVFEKYCGGTSYPTIESHYISKFPVPLFNKFTAEKVRDLVSRARTDKKTSQSLLEQAKASVERLIEEAIKR